MYDASLVCMRVDNCECHCYIRTGIKFSAQKINAWLSMVLIKSYSFTFMRFNLLMLLVVVVVVILVVVEMKVV